ncbi:hypothetical protein [Catenuloplanes atrovinosus]|uniref:Uncharacterized protein n=1 Tax=Catenuloplanes atrovinosus TaxID=137266 RepID=A0AAE3YPC6_9ACTN|nr:hypothetical protein [Catenuloplanes atrovinosus]MDR7277205.1 hypothetical protein [Catenuloplanes atrovinosus]
MKVEAMRKSFSRSLAAAFLAAVVSAVGVVAAPAAAQAHPGWATCLELSNGHLCARGVDNGQSTDIMYDKTGGSEITARFYLVWKVNGSRVYDNGSWMLYRGVRSFVFSGARFVDYRRCMEVQGQGSFCV